MGMYVIPCKQCDESFMWWSGRLDQRCDKCRGDTEPAPVAELDAALAMLAADTDGEPK